MNQTKSVAPYTAWEPAISAAEVFRAGVTLTSTTGDESGRLFWIEMRPQEQGRCVIMMRDLSGNIHEILPPPYSARSRVMEYGGMPYVAKHGRVVFSNFADQRLYEIDLNKNGAVRPLTTEKNAAGQLMKYMQPDISPDGRWLAAACEIENGTLEPENAICLLDLSLEGANEPQLVVRGADFYKRPLFSPDGKSLAWLEWNHPFMPWDSTYLKLVPFADGLLDTAKTLTVAGADDICINDYAFHASGSLYYVLDAKSAVIDSADNYFNLYCFKNGGSTRITDERRDIYQFMIKDDRIIAQIFNQGVAGLADVNEETGRLAEIKTPFAAVSVPVAAGDRLAVFGVYADRPRCIAFLKDAVDADIVKVSADADIDAEDISRPEAIAFPTADGQTCYGYFYPPVNRRYTAPDGDLPPVRVHVHGGPTAMTGPGFSRPNTFWTSQGYAVFDVNYRGSFGHGRAYRDALLGQWGVLEIADVRDGLAWLKKQGRIGNIAVVSGGSAGGYTVQRLLTEYPDMFAAGASHFGIGNLVTLQKLTHKFESRYMIGLLGGSLEEKPEIFAERSPINHLENLKSPMIIFQGAEDKVVPPENSREMAEILARKGIMHEYHEYEGEAHGFRKKENLEDSLKREAAFFRKVINKAG